jgi:DNA-binding PadR family transcriptional regulator
MGGEPRMTMPVILILSAILQRPDEEWYGLELSELADLKSGTIYPALLRLEEAGWLESRWEEVDPSEVKRPRRRLYRLTGVGQTVARDAVEAHHRKLKAVVAPFALRKARPA